MEALAVIGYSARGNRTMVKHDTMMGERRLNRRNALRLVGLGGALFLFGCADRQGQLGVAGNSPTTSPDLYGQRHGKRADCFPYDPKHEEKTLPAKVNGCVLDAERLAPLKECMEACGPPSPRDGWNHACIHPRTVAYDCGRIVRPGVPNRHDHPPGEIERCRRLAEEAAKVMEGFEVGFGTEGFALFFPFFITANRGDPAPDALTPETICTLFGGTIYPNAEILVDPLEERGSWWQWVTLEGDESFDDLSPSEQQRYKHLIEEARQIAEECLRRWRSMIAWFDKQPELHGPAFVMIGELPLGDTNFGCVFPRLAIALTELGSVVGICGPVVHT